MKVFVFDLDFTLWDAGGTWCDATSPPYRWVSGRLLDTTGAWIRLYPDVREILTKLNEKGKVLVAASRTYEPDWAHELLHLLSIDHYFQQMEIYPSTKLRHFQNIRQNLKVPFSDMVFFDDEHRNIAEVGSLGVETVHVLNGIQMDQVERFL